MLTVMLGKLMLLVLLSMMECKLPKKMSVDMFESAVPLVCFWENQVLDFVVCYVSFCICIVFPNTQPLGCVICVVL